MRRALLVFVAAAAVVVAIGVTWRQHERAAGLDFYIYFVNAQLAGRTDVGNIYDRDTQSRLGEEYYERAQRSSSELRKYDGQRRRFLDSVSSPFLYTTLSWVSRDYDRALMQYHVLVLAAFIAGVLMIGRAARLPFYGSLFLVAGLLLWYRGFEADLRVGNVNSLQLAALGAALLSPPAIAGAIVGLLVAFKPNLVIVPALLVIARLASRDWPRLRRESAGAFAGVVLALCAAALRYGSFEVWVQWVSRANEFYHRLPTRMERNVTPFLELFHSQGAWVSHTMAVALFLIAAIVIWRSRTNDDVLIVGMAILVYLLSATVVWLHYMVLVVPVAVALMRRRWGVALSVVALAAIAEEPWELLSRSAIYPHDAWLIGPALLALFVGACAAGWWSRRSDSAPSSAFGTFSPESGEKDLETGPSC